MKTNIKYTKNEAIVAATEFLKEVQVIQEKYGMLFNSDSEDIHLVFKNRDLGNTGYWDHVNVGWEGDGTGIKVTEEIKDKEYYKKQALSKLTKEEKEALNL